MPPVLSSPELARSTITALQRFHDCMQYRSSTCRPNHELGVWAQTAARWRAEAPAAVTNFSWDWFAGENALGLDRRQFIPVNFDFIPHFQPQVLEETSEYVVARNHKGIVSKALKEGSVGGARMCMDEYIRFPVQTLEDFRQIKKRLVAAVSQRYPQNLEALIAGWKQRDDVLVLGHNCAANGFYWRAREFMGTELLSYAWYDQPQLMHEMMEFYADFIIECSRPVLEKIQVDYFCLNEDLSMKNGPLLSPQTFRTYIFPHLKRMVAFFKSHGTKYFAVDTDGNPSVLLPLFMDAGVDVIWPIERAAGVSPQVWRSRFGKSLRLWGGVDKRVLAQDPAAIRAHLREFIPLIEEGGFIPTVDHTVPPDVSWDNFRYYLDAKQALLSGHYAKLG